MLNWHTFGPFSGILAHKSARLKGATGYLKAKNQHLPQAPAAAPEEFLFDEKIKQQLLACVADAAMPLISDSDDSDNDDDL